MYIGRLVNEIVHSLVKRNMLCCLDLTRGNVIVANILHGTGITKKDTSASVSDQFSRVMMGWQSIDMTTKSMQQTKIGLFASTNGIWRGMLRMVSCDIVEAEIVLKGIGLKFWFQSSSPERNSQPFCNGAMGMPSRAILMRRVRCSCFYSISSQTK